LLELGGLRQQRVQLGAAPVLSVEEVLGHGWFLAVSAPSGLALFGSFAAETFPGPRKRKNPAWGWVFGGQHGTPVTQQESRIPVGARARSSRRPFGRRWRRAAAGRCSWVAHPRTQARGAQVCEGLRVGLLGAG